MESRNIWSYAPISESWEKWRKAPVSVRWVDVDKGGEERMEVRSRLVARDFKGGDKDRGDLFAETAPLEAKRMFLSRAATRRRDGRIRKILFYRCEEGTFESESGRGCLYQFTRGSELPTRNVWEIELLALWL